MRFVSGLLALLSPPSCAACQLSMPPTVDGIFCPGCEPLLELAPRGQRPPATSAAAYVFGGPLAEAIRSFKYQGRPELGRGLGALLVATAQGYAGRVDVVMPIPLHHERLVERGFNQSALLARPLARSLGVPLDVDSLRRVRPTRVQAGLTREARLANVKGAFRAQPRETGRRVLLLDDVRTTGATLAAAAIALRSRGVGEVVTLALAYAEA